MNKTPSNISSPTKEVPSKKSQPGNSGWFVWWRNLLPDGRPGPWSRLHQFSTLGETKCKILVKDESHRGLRITRRIPQKHTLKICKKCYPKGIIIGPR